MSNKKDYTVQMIRWLSRQEALDRFTVYINWCRNKSYTQQTCPTYSLKTQTTEQELETILVQNTLLSVQTSSPPHPNQTQATKLGTITLSSQQSGSKGQTTFKVPKTHPKELRSVSCDDIVAGHGASQFLPALQDFLCIQGGQTTAQQHDHFSLYKQLVIKLPNISEVNASKTKNVIRATSPLAAKGRSSAQTAKLDFALIRTGERNEYTDGTALEGKSL